MSDKFDAIVAQIRRIRDLYGEDAQSSLEELVAPQISEIDARLHSRFVEVQELAEAMCEIGDLQSKGALITENGSIFTRWIGRLGLKRLAEDEAEIREARAQADEAIRGLRSLRELLVLEVWGGQYP